MIAAFSGPSRAAEESVGLNRSLDGDWRFATAAMRGEGSWDRLPVPGSWNTFTEYADYIGDGWYRRDVAVPDGWKGKRIYLKFDAVYDIADVWIGDEYLGQHTGGYTPFEFDVTESAKPGDTVKVTVKANNEHVLGAWYQWGGISRSVSLFAREELRLIRQKIEPVGDVVTGTAEVGLAVTVESKSSTDQEVAIFGKISELEDVAFRLTGKVPAGETVTLSGSIRLNSTQTRWWHFDDPQLYRLETTLVQGSRILDALNERFGVRHVEVRTDGLYLNGEKIRVMGYNRVHDHRAYGNTEPAHLVRADIDMMKRSGANFSRIMHAPCSPDLLDYCDEKGYLLWAEIPVWQTVFRVPMNNKEDAANAVDLFPGKAMREMMQRDWNHPSIIGWSPGNEMRHETDLYVKAMRPLVKELDPTRLYANIHDQGFAQSSKGGYVDIDVNSVDLMMINGYGNNEQKLEKLKKQHEKVPNGPIFWSEYGGKRGESLDHTEDFGPFWEKQGEMPHVIGGALWTYNDYRSLYEKTPASQNRDWGTVDVWRNPKQLYHHMSSLGQPVRSIGIEKEDGASTATVVIQPRAKLEVPSFTLRGYSWVHELLDESGRVIEGGIHEMETVEPDGPAIQSQISWNDPKARMLVVSLLTNNGYTVAESRYDLKQNEAVHPPVPGVAADPEVRKVLPLDQGFMVGVTSKEGDQGLEVSYGKKDNDEISLSAPVMGAIRIRGLENGVVYHGRVRRLLADGPGPWSPGFEVVPDGGLPPAKPTVLGVIRGEGKLVVRLEPQEKIVGYEVTLKDGKLVQIEGARFDLLVLPKGSVRLAARGEHGVSESVSF